MLRNILFLFTLASFACGSLFGQKGYQIEVEIAGATGEETYLAYYFGDKQYIKDTVALTDGKATFAGDESLDGGIYLVVLPPENNYFEVLVDQDQFFKVKTDAKDFVGNMQIEGSEDNELFYGDLQYLQAKRKELEGIQGEMKTAEPGSDQEKALQAKLKGLDGEVKSHRDQMLADHPDHLFTKIVLGTRDPQIPDFSGENLSDSLKLAKRFRYYKDHYFDNLDWADERLLRTPVLYNRVNNYMERLTSKYQPDSINKSLELVLTRAQANHETFQFLLAHYLNKFVESKVMGMDAVYCNLVEKYYRNEELVDWVDSAARAKMIEQCARISYTIIGNPAPDFRLKDVEDTYRTLSGTEADHTIVYFWDYDCGHCKKITPRLQKLFTKYQLGDKKVKLITININGDVDVWKEKIKEYNLDTDGAIINTEDIERKSYATAYYNITSTPRMFLLDENKKILAKQITPEQMIDILGRKLAFEVAEEDKMEVPEEEGEETEDSKK